MEGHLCVLQLLVNHGCQCLSGTLLGGGRLRLPSPQLHDVASPGLRASAAHHLISAGATSSWVAGQDLQHLAQGHHSSAAIDGIVLYTYGTGPIKGFSVTLMIGILTTLFTGIFVSRTFMDFLARKSTARLSI